MSLVEQLEEQLKNVEWNGVTERNALLLGNRLNTLNVVEQKRDLRQAVYKTSLGSNISSLTLAVVCMVFGLGAEAALIAVVLSQCLRVVWFKWKAGQAQREVIEATADATEFCKSFAETYHGDQQSHRSK